MKNQKTTMSQVLNPQVQPIQFLKAYARANFREVFSLGLHPGSIPGLAKQVREDHSACFTVHGAAEKLETGYRARARIKACTPLTISARFKQRNDRGEIMMGGVFAITASTTTKSHESRPALNHSNPSVRAQSCISKPGIEPSEGPDYPLD